MDSIKLGDEITFTVDCSTTFFDLASGKEIDYSDARNLGSSISFGKYDSTEMTMVKAANQLSYNLIKGSPVKPIDSTERRDYRFTESNGRYVFELRVKPKTSGLYIVAFSNSANVFREGDPCTKAGFTINLVETRHNRYLVGYGDEATPGGDFYFHVSP